MIDNCTCICNGCHSRSQKSFRYSFPKKLLVATSVVIVLTMCLATVEARAIEHRFRHGRRHDPQPTKEAKLRMPERRQAQLVSNKAKDIAREYRSQMQTIQSKLKNTMRFLNEERGRVLNESNVYKRGMSSWVPSTNFLAIHNNNYHRNGTSDRWNRASIAERKFLFIMPKLYRSLQTFYNIFRRLIDVKVDAPDEAFVEYSKNRDELMKKTLGRLYSTVAAVKDSLIAYNVTVPRVAARNLEQLSANVDAVQSLRNDYIAFRSYSNLLKNWYAELKCSKGNKRKNSGKKICIAYEATLRKKKDQHTKSGSS